MKNFGFVSRNNKVCIDSQEVLNIIDKYAEQQKCDTCYHNKTEFSVCQYCTDGDKYEKAEQEPKVTTTSTDEPMVMQYPQVDGITQTVVKAEQEPSRDIKEIAEIMKCGADAETKCKMVSNILTAKPHYFAKQEPCDDVVSREWLKKKLQEHHDFFVNAYGEFKNMPQTDKARVDEITNCIAEVVNAPSVRPQEQIGHWIDTKSKDFEFHRVYKCSECGNTEIEYPESIHRHFRYCRNCGARMVEPTCDTCEYNTAAFMPCNACEDKSEYKPQESEDKG